MLVVIYTNRLLEEKWGYLVDNFCCSIGVIEAVGKLQFLWVLKLLMKLEKGSKWYFVVSRWFCKTDRQLNGKVEGNIILWCCAFVWRCKIDRPTLLSADGFARLIGSYMGRLSYVELESFVSLGCDQFIGEGTRLTVD